MRRLILSVSLALLAVPAAAAGQRPEDYDYENLAFRGLGVWAFGVVPARSESTLGLHMRADLGELGPNIRISPSVTFWSANIRDGELTRMEERIEAACERSGVPCAGIDLGEVSLSDLSLDVDAHYLWTTGFGLEPYAGVGVGLHLVNGRGDFVDGTFVEDVLDAITPGLNVMGGVELPLGLSLRLQGEVRGVLASNARSVGVGIGGSWTLPAAMQRPRPPAPEAPR